MSFSPETLALAKQYTDKKISQSGGGTGSPVKSVSDEFLLSEYGELQVAEISSQKITGLPDALVKLSNIPEDAEKNTINYIEINGVQLPNNNTTITIPIGSQQSPGVVMSSLKENQVSINVDGTMEVNSVNVSKLVQDDGTSILLNSGSSQI